MVLHRLSRIAKWRRWVSGLAVFCSGILFTAISDMMIASQGIKILVGFAIVALLAGLISLVVQKDESISVRIYNPLTIRTAQEEEDYGRRGFVGFVPLYNPKRDSPGALLSKADRKAAIQNADFNKLALEESNLEPTIKAICSHRQQLKHCWLLSTEGEKAAGSLAYAELLASYLRKHKGLQCKFYYGDGYTISLDDDALVLGKTYDLVQRTFKEAIQKQLKPEEIVADMTTGFRSMTLGMVLACLDKERDIEFMGTHYDEEGKPIPNVLTPIIFSFEPDMQQT